MDMAKYPLVKEQLKSLQQSLMRLSKSASKIVELNQSQVIETLDFGKELNVLLSQEDSLLSKCFSDELDTERVFSKFISISEQINSDVLLQDNRVVEPINAYLDLLTAYKVKIIKIVSLINLSLVKNLYSLNIRTIDKYLT
jgi:hypothetical protein